MKVVFHRLAIREYLQARRWYAERSQSAAERFKAAVEIATNEIE